jgi:hypothetical protein
MYIQHTTTNCHNLTVTHLHQIYFYLLYIQHTTTNCHNLTVTHLHQIYFFLLYIQHTTTNCHNLTVTSTSDIIPLAVHSTHNHKLSQSGYILYPLVVPNAIRCSRFYLFYAFGSHFVILIVLGSKPHSASTVRWSLFYRIYIYVYIDVTLEQATKAHKGNRGVAILFL